MSSSRSCRETFTAADFPPIPIPCSNPHPGHTLHRAKWQTDYAGRVWNISMEWTVEEKVYVSA